MLKIKKYMGVFFAAAGAGMFFTSSVYAAWTPLIVADDFIGIRTDVGVVAAGVISIMLVVIGVGIIIRVLSR